MTLEEWHEIKHKKVKSNENIQIRKKKGQSAKNRTIRTSNIFQVLWRNSNRLRKKRVGNKIKNSNCKEILETNSNYKINI